MTDVSTPNPQYTIMAPIWSLCRDAVTGNSTIKAAGDKYLPKFVPHDADRYNSYLTRAYFMNVTARTLKSLSGMAFRKAPVVELPTAMEPLLENIDGAGQSLYQLSKEALDSLLIVGRHGLMVDYPSVDDSMDAETQQRMDVQPVLVGYTAESIINWRVSVIGGQRKLTLVVLAETSDASATEFGHEVEVQYRVLRLRDGTYTQQKYDAQGQPLSDEFVPLQSGGASFDHIPFYIVGASDNLPAVDMPPLYDIAILNIAHYQTTADHRENLHIHGQLTLGVTSNLSVEEFQRANPNGLYVGSRSGHFLGETGAFHSVTAPESSSLSKALDDLEAQMVALGARLVDPSAQTETATAARINASAEASTLDTVIGNLEEALEAGLEDMARFIGAGPDAVTLTLNREFWAPGVDAALVSAVVQAGDAGLIAKSDQLHMIRSGRIEIRPDRTDEEIQEEIASGLLDI